MLYSSTLVVYREVAGTKYLSRQLMWCVLGLVGAVIAAFSDYRKIKKYSFHLLALAVFGLVLVYVPHFGASINGARRWIRFLGMTFQPSEFAKFAMVIALAFYCEYYQRKITNFREGIVIPGLFIGFVTGLIFIEPDRGCFILMASVSVCLLIIAGVKLRYVIGPFVLGCVGLAYSLIHDPMRLKRIHAWLHPEETKLGVGLQAYESMIAFGSGGWTGLGLGNGRQKMDFVPEHHTDFILSVIGEELGLIATLAVLVTFIVLLICAAGISRRASDTFGVLLGSGITFIIGFQTFINIGVVTSVLPNKGMPLPFISYGGSNLFMMLIGIGLLLSISRFAVEPEKRKKNPFETRSPELADV